MKNLILSAGLLVAISFASKQSSTINLGYLASQEMSPAVNAGVTGAAGTAGAYAGVWAAAEIGAAAGTTVGPVGTFFGAVIGAGVGAY